MRRRNLLVEIFSCSLYTSRVLRSSNHSDNVTGGDFLEVGKSMFKGQDALESHHSTIELGVHHTFQFLLHVNDISLNHMI